MPTVGERRALHRSSGLTCTLHDSLDSIAPEEWAVIVDQSEDLAMDRRLLAVQQRSLVGQCRMWFAVVRTAAGDAQAIACLCLFKVDSTISAHPALQHATALARRLHADLLRFNVLFCGLPIPAGESHVRFAPQANIEETLACLHQRMRSLAREHRASLLVLKEFDAARSDIAGALQRIGCHPGEVPPMYCLRGSHTNFGAMLAAMRSRYRAQVLRSRRKIAANGFVIEHHVDAASIARAFAPEAHALYDAVWQRSRYRLERLPRGFFLEAAAALPDDTALTVIRRAAGPTVGFTFSIARGRRWHNLYSGVDYSINGEGDILFNLFYADLDLAFRRGCTSIALGQTADEFKARLGAVAQPLRFFVHAPSRLVHAGLRTLAPCVFPRAPVVPASHVFKDRPIIDIGLSTPAPHGARRLCHEHFTASEVDRSPSASSAMLISHPA